MSIFININYARVLTKRKFKILSYIILYKVVVFTKWIGKKNRIIPKLIIKDLGFKYAFGQHSGVTDDTKDFYELPRFPINETYGQLERFELILKTIPLKIKSITPTEKYINDANNPPDVIIEFLDQIKNIKLLNCYSNELNSWRKSKIEYLDNFKIRIKLVGKFTTERGRINCSLREPDGSWRWLGMQFVVAEL